TILNPKHCILCRQACSGLWFSTPCSMNDLTEDRGFPPRHAVGSSAPPSPLDEETDRVQHAKNDPAAFGELYEAHYQSILNYLYATSRGLGTSRLGRYSASDWATSSHRYIADWPN